MRQIATCIFLLLCVISFAQTKDLSTLPHYDCSLKKVMAIIARPTTIVSPDRASGLDAILADYCGTFGNNCILKKESQLTDSDYQKDILLVGVVADFKNWEKLKIAVTRIDTGFLINNTKFQNRSDGFVYIDTNRIVISGNSLEAIKVAQLALTGGHDLLVVQHNKITYFGNKIDNHFDWFNLQSLKSTNYVEKSSALFSAIYVSKTFNDTINYQRLNKELRAYARQFLTVYNLKMPVKKVSWFIHSNMDEYGTMSGMFGFTCPGTNSAGFSIRGEIHTNGYNTPLVKHEYSHFLFDNSIPQDNNPAFFVEGSVEYVTNMNDGNSLRQGISNAKKFKDSLNYENLIVYNRDFYGQYSAVNYSVCGVFVKYIIENFGVEAFKSYCRISNKATETKNIFKMSFEELVRGYNNWLEKL